MAKSMSDYVNEAKNQLQGTYDQIKNEATNKYNNSINNYNNQYTETGANFDKQVETNKNNGMMNQNQYNNNTLSRGLGRSSIATTGLAGIQNTTNKVEGELLAGKQNELNKITSLKNQLTEAYNNQLLGFDSELESKAQQMAQELKKYDDYLAHKEWEKQQAIAQQQWEREKWEKDQANLAAQQQWEKDKWNQQSQWEKDKWNQQLQWEKDKLSQQLAAQERARAAAASRAASRSSSRSGGKMESVGSLAARLDGMNPGEANAWLQQNKNAVVNQYGRDKYEKLNQQVYGKYSNYANAASGGVIHHEVNQMFRPSNNTSYRPKYMNSVMFR